MKKSIIFLINGLGIEKPGSYSIDLDQLMPQLGRVKETSYFTTAITSSLEYKDAYQRFFLGETYKYELEFVHNNVMNQNLLTNPTYQQFGESIKRQNSKIHIFLEPTNDRVIEEINNLVNTLTIGANQQIFLHLVLSQQTVSEYDNLTQIINYIKFHLHNHMTVGFIMGKEYLPDELTKKETDYLKRLLFYCSCERWTETEKKLQNLRDAKIRPCEVEGFCATNECFISNGDTILFFNTRKNNYDNLITGIYQMAPEVYKAEVTLPIYSLLKLDTKYNIPSFLESIEYTNSLAKTLEKYNKKALIITDQKNINLVNFYANGMNSVNNPNISFILKDDRLYQKEFIEQLINTTPYDLIIFDYHMDVSSNINKLKEGLQKMDPIIGLIADVSENKHSFFITSLYGLKKDIPLADYNSEIVTIDYEMQIPIFFFDYTYPKGKFYLAPGETNDILSSALRCVIDDPNLYTLVKQKGLINNLIKAFK